MFHPGLKGHLPVRQRLLERLETGRLSSSLLFAGPDGIGKRRVALELPQRELCLRRCACGVCEGCRLFETDPLPVELPNLLRIAPEGKAGLIRIGAIRDDDLVEGGVIRWAHQAPAPGCHRWILIEDAHRLNSFSANILLKTLEEPPAGTRFLLVTHRPEAVLQTIRSRCERIPFHPLAASDLGEVALKAGWAASELAPWLALSGGTLRYLEPAAFQRARVQVEAWMALLAGRPFAEVAASLLPDKDASLAQGEQLGQGLELLLLVLLDVERRREGKPLRLDPWRASIESLAQGALELRAPQASVFDAMRNLIRNPAPEPLLRSVAATFK
ncbi:hypothetical protein [Holophaga foetida]|uniref:hypothetical protein n=1 Tax=Holophaga foetida TaxID=35839 RepID=UPI0002472F25|nr:hypothetical protein [Holophaga foetida]